MGSRRTALVLVEGLLFLYLALATNGCGGPQANQISPSARPLTKGRPAMRPDLAFPPFPLPETAEAIPGGIKQPTASQAIAGNEIYQACEDATINDAEGIIELVSSENHSCWTSYELAGYPGASNEVTLELTCAGQVPSEYWAGISDYQAASWEWQLVPGPNTGEPVAFPAGSYTSYGGGIYLAIVVTEGQAMTVQGIEAAVTTLPVADFTAPTGEANVPVEITLDASASVDPDGGEIVRYEWDWENDGSYISTGASPFYTKFVTEGGQRLVSLRVTDDEGSMCSANGAVNLTGWQLYIAEDGAEARSDVHMAVDIEGNLIVIGACTDASGELCILKLDPSGDVLDARMAEVGSTVGASCYGCAVDSAGNLYLTLGEYLPEMRLVKLNPQWEVEWGRSWPGPGVWSGDEFSIEFDSENNVILSGMYRDSNGDAPMVAKLAADGTQLFVRNYKPSYLMPYHYDSVVTSQDEIVIVGHAMELAAPESSWFTFLLKLDPDGELIAKRKFHELENGILQRARSVAIDQHDKLYILGETDDMGKRLFVICCDTNGVVNYSLATHVVEHDTWFPMRIAYEPQSDSLLLCDNVRGAVFSDIQTRFHQLALDGTVLRSVRLAGEYVTITAGLAVGGDGELYFNGYSFGEYKHWKADDFELWPVSYETSDLEVSETENLSSIQGSGLIMHAMNYTINDFTPEKDRIMIGCAKMDNWPEPE